MGLESIFELLGGDTIPIVLVVLVILSLFPGGGAAMKQLFGLPFKGAWAMLRLLVSGVKALHWHLWRRPRVEREMWEEERALRAQWGAHFKERSPIPTHVFERYGWEEAPASSAAIEQASGVHDDEGAFFRSFEPKREYDE